MKSIHFLIFQFHTEPAGPASTRPGNPEITTSRAALQVLGIQVLSKTGGTEPCRQLLRRWEISPWPQLGWRLGGNSKNGAEPLPTIDEFAASRKQGQRRRWPIEGGSMPTFEKTTTLNNVKLQV
jgi:hypothetical protein